MEETKSQKIFEESYKYEPRFMSEHVPIVWDSAKGIEIFDVEGNRYIDFTSGILVANIGHSHSKYVRAIEDQVSKLLTCYDFMNKWRVKLSKKLVELTPKNLDNVYLLTTGTEAVESALKLARFYTQKSEVFSFHMSFHGRTIHTLSIGGKKSRKVGFGPFSSGVVHAPYAYCYRCPFGKMFPSCNFHCIKHLDYLFDTESSDDVSSLIIEPYQGAGGVIFPPDGYLKKIEEWCRRKNILMIVDEVQAGFGRTGKLFGFMHDKVEPDIICCGKGLTGGIPGSAVIFDSKLGRGIRRGGMSCTYAGNPLVGRAGLAVLEILEEENLIENSKRMGSYIIDDLKTFAEKLSYVGDIRGRGLVIGLEIVKDKKTKEPYPKRAKEIVRMCYKKGLLVLGPDGFFGNIVELAPPLIITKDKADEALNIIKEVMENLK